ncbi:hypothetical protein [Corallococcus sp. AB049A]|uniref:hypothetical protein n=1 Tax=Corallococcus sp. AB049A TaxID=2316721 RepID=UPI0018F41C0C|nr:hypothetical protein [Corallococcus sp. AB049A]
MNRSEHAKPSAQSVTAGGLASAAGVRVQAAPCIPVPCDFSSVPSSAKELSAAQV